jgi:hypothetical protein
VELRPRTAELLLEAFTSLLYQRLLQHRSLR